ncbi:MAG: SDR family oxidoreductase [bacterium]|nr:SDR family oxidoreductase [bacterium]
MTRVLIAGCGDVGTALGLRLAGEGHRVLGLRRDPAHLPAAIVPLAADLADPATLAVLPGDVDALVYAAAADRRDDDAYRRTYVDGLGHVLTRLRDAGAPLRRLVYVSSTAVHAQDDGGWVDEDSPADPVHFAGRRLREGERLALASGVPAAVLRLAGIYGPGRTRLVDEVRAGTAVVAADPPVWTNRIHRDDCAGAIAHLLALPSPAPIWLGVDHEPAERGVVLDWLADRLGVARPRRVPSAPRERGGNKRCDGSRLRASGYVFRYPTFREGYAGILAGAR